MGGVYHVDEMLLHVKKAKQRTDDESFRGRKPYRGNLLFMVVDAFDNAFLDLLVSEPKR
jgi:hypothetical protein